MMLCDAVSNVALVDSAAVFTVGVALPEVASIVVSLLGELTDKIWSKAPLELAKANRVRFDAAGFTASEIDTILGSHWYTPTWQTILASSVIALDGVDNVSAIAAPIGSAQSYDEARFITQIVAMLARYQATEMPLASMIDTPCLPQANDAD